MSNLSEAKIAANRANAQLSTGPTSEAGKAKVRLNAVKTGLTGRTVLLPADDVVAYEAMVARFTAQWQPATEEECHLVQCLADNQWRMQRIPVLEYGIFAMGELEFAEQFAAETNPEVRRTLLQTKVFFAYHKQLTSLHSQESRLRRQRQQDETTLRNLQAQRKADQAKATAREAKAQASAQCEKAHPQAQQQQPRGFEFTTPGHHHETGGAPCEFRTESGEKLKAA